MASLSSLSEKECRRTSATTRQMKRGETVPDFEPCRYLSAHGYVRLRWLVGVQSYVETYEHRVFDGVVTTADHVHHRNGVKTDNRPENLEILTADEHNAHHAAERRGQGKWYPFRSQSAMLKAAYAEYRRRERDVRTDLMRRLYAQGLTTVAIGRLVGLHNASVSRYLLYGRNP